MKAFKAVSIHEDGIPYSLGMGKAQIIPLPLGTWIDGGEHGISGSNTEAKAGKVIKYAGRRKTLPIPPNMCVAQIRGEGIRFANEVEGDFDEIIGFYPDKDQEEERCAS